MSAPDPALVEELYDEIESLLEPCKCSECRHQARDHYGSLPETATKAKIAEVLARHASNPTDKT